MFLSYVRIALRNFLKRKGYSAINVVGLAVGLACCLLIVEYVIHEYSFDRFNTNFSHLYRVTQTNSEDGDVNALAGYALGPALKEEVPEVVRFTRLHPDYNIPVISDVEHPEKAFEEKRVYYADPGFLQMFTYPFVSGNPEEALAESATMLITESTARKYFGTTDPLGKTLKVTGWISGNFRVSGVLRDIPETSHLQFDILLPMTDLLQKSAYRNLSQEWTWSNFLTYVQLRPNVNLPSVEEKFTNVIMTHRKGDFEKTKKSIHANAQPLSDVHLNDKVFAPQTVMGSYRAVYFFVFIGAVTLLIALVNYVNLATARSLDRAREVGIRKTVGARRGQLISQFLMESALTNLGAIFFAIIISEFLRPVLDRLAGTQLTEDLMYSPDFWGALVVIFLAGTLLAGLYPAFVLSSFLPSSVLRGKRGLSSSLKLHLRQGLVVLQFSASIVLLAGTIIVYNQLNYVRSMDLGLNLDQVMAVRGPSVLPPGANLSVMMSTMEQQFRQIPAIEHMATSSALPGEGFDWYSSGLRQVTADPSTGVPAAFASIDTNFARLFDLKIIAGEGFVGQAPQVLNGEPQPAIANEIAIKMLRFDSPEQSLNQLVTMGGRTFRIIGVLKDFNWSSAHVQREAILFTQVDAGSILSFKVHTANLGQTVASIQSMYTSLFPGNPFEYHFVDERFDEQYRNDDRFATLFAIFAALAILIATLGLFGLASFTAEQRTKEVGVRKVLGASVVGIVGMLSKDFLMLVLAANVVAWPITYYVMSRWLQNFAYRVDMSWWVFGLAGGTALLIALLTVSIQAIKAALSNPVKALRYE